MQVAKTVFMFSGQGSQYYQMGKQLFESDGLFREWMARLDAMARNRIGESVIDAIYGSGKAEVFDRTLLTHPAIFMIEYALAQCLLREGVVPDMTLGTSLGSFTAAAVSGHLDVGDAMSAVLEQAEAFESSCDRGGIIAILAEPSLFEDAFLQARSERAGINFSNHFAVSAAAADLDAIEAELKRRGLTHQRLAVSYAFHSRWIDRARDRFTSFMRSVSTRPGGALVCCDRATTLTALPEDFFWHVVRREIRFRDTIEHLEQQGPHRYIDVGPSGTLATFVKYAVSANSGSTAYPILTPYGQDRKNLAAVLDAVRPN